MHGLILAAGHGKSLWYVTRSTGAVALVLLSASVVLGVANTGSRVRFSVPGLHRNLTLLALAFVSAHLLTTVADAFAPIGFRDAVIPFVSPYRPIWLGLGAIAFDLLLALIVTSLLRVRIGLGSWRVVHWLAYASWPLALLHSFGTGSDARFGWFQILAVVSAGAVAAVMLWRAATARNGGTPLRAGVAVAAAVVPLGVVVWASAGPLRPGWAARSGTPRRILALRRIPKASQLAVRDGARKLGGRAALPRRAFGADVTGTFRRSFLAGGDVVVRIEGVAHGGFDGRIYVALRGPPVGDGGVQMTTSATGLLPRGAPRWFAGRVTALSGTRIDGSVAGLQYVFDVAIDPQAGTVTGTLRGRPG